MPRLAGDSDHYEFRLCRIVGGVKAIPTPYGYRVPSSTHILETVLGIPAGAMSYHGFREGMKAAVILLDEDYAEVLQHADTAEELEEFFKAKGFTPNTGRDAAGARGTAAHLVVECLAEGWNHQNRPVVVENPGLRAWAEALAMDEEHTHGTRYGWAGIEWWDEKIQPYINSGEILDVISELPVFSLDGRYAGTLDLAILWAGREQPTWDGDEDHVSVIPGGWEVADVKTHKPASGFTKPGHGPGYDKDAAQIRSYRTAVEEIAKDPNIVGYPLPPGAKTIGQRTVVLRDRAYKGKSYLEDFREVSEEYWDKTRRLYELRQAFNQEAS
jgi:hypothetical protein